MFTPNHGEANRDPCSERGELRDDKLGVSCVRGLSGTLGANSVYGVSIILSRLSLSVLV